jgi:hypothetical protein
MKGRLLILVAAIAAQLMLAFLPMIPGLKNFLPSTPSAREQLEWPIQVIGFGFAVLTACVGLLIVLQEKSLNDFTEFTKKLFPVTRIEKLRDDEFYDSFLLAAKRARHSVNIMYLAPRPPDYTEHQERKEYYHDLLSVIQRRQQVRFSRIVRQTTETKQWIADLLRELTGSANAYLCVIRDTEREEMPLGLSTQIMDESRVWFVALSSHERTGEYRDIFIEHPVVGEAMQRYFDRVWLRGKVLLDAGRVTRDGEQFLESLNESQNG